LGDGVGVPPPPPVNGGALLLEDPPPHPATKRHKATQNDAFNDFLFITKIDPAPMIGNLMN